MASGSSRPLLHQLSHTPFPWLTGDVPRLPSYGIYISWLVTFARCCTSVLDFHSKNLQITSELLTQGYRYHKLRKTFGKLFRSYSELLSKFGDISFQEYLSKGSSPRYFTVTKEGRRQTQFHLVGFENSQTPSTTTV